MSPASDWWQQAVAAPDHAAMQAARRRQARLTKPAGSLGALETLAIRLAGLQGCACPRLEHVHISVFAADHGVAIENVSAFPQAVTAQMIDNFAVGGGAINVLARQLGASLEVIDLGTVAPSRGGDIVRREHIAPATANLAQQPAMSMAQLRRALASGRHAVERALATGAQLFIGGEMGIANTTAATALASQLLDLPPAQLTGPGTGLDASGVARKTRVIESALQLHGRACTTPLETLRRLGGFEIAALSGALIAAAQHRLPVLVDGYIVGVSALVASRLVERIGDCLIYSHRSAEPGHRSVLAALSARPLLDLDLRLGEGSGAAIAVPLLRMACALHGEMASFSDARVATGNA